jgi:hypothetical protein
VELGYLGLLFNAIAFNATNGAFPSQFMIALHMIHEQLPFLFNEESI